MSQVFLRTTIAGCGVALLFTSIACNRVNDGEADIEMSPREALIARAAALELGTPYVPPPGDALTHHTSGFAKVLCSAVFITGLDADFAAESIGYFQSPYDERAKVTERVVDLEKKEWQLVDIPLESFDLDVITRIGFWGRVQGTFYVDDLRLVAVAAPARPPVATTVLEEQPHRATARLLSGAELSQSVQR